MGRASRPLAHASGRVFHKFHGNYWCVVVLCFDNAEQAAAALAVLPGFAVAENATDALVASFTGKAVDKAMRLLKKHRIGDKTHEIAGVPFSIDCGPEFEIAVPVDALPAAAPTQVV